MTPAQLEKIRRLAEALPDDFHVYERSDASTHEIYMGKRRVGTIVNYSGSGHDNKALETALCAYIPALSRSVALALVKRIEELEAFKKTAHDSLHLSLDCPYCNTSILQKALRNGAGG